MLTLRILSNSRIIKNSLCFFKQTFVFLKKPSFYFPSLNALNFLKMCQHHFGISNTIFDFTWYRVGQKITRESEYKADAASDVTEVSGWFTWTDTLQVPLKKLLVDLKLVNIWISAPLLTNVHPLNTFSVVIWFPPFCNINWKRSTSVCQASRHVIVSDLQCVRRFKAAPLPNPVKTSWALRTTAGKSDATVHNNLPNFLKEANTTHCMFLKFLPKIIIHHLCLIQCFCPG